MTDTITLKDGRLLAYAEYGDPAGTPVFFFHGTPGSRLFRPSDSITLKLGVRLICTDRPGYGASTFQPGRRLLDWPVVTEPKSRLDGETERLAGDAQEPASQVPPVEQVAPLGTQVSATQQPPPEQTEVPQDTPAASEAAASRSSPPESGVAGGRSGVPPSTGRTSVAVYGAVGGVKLLVHTATPLTTRSSSM